MSRQELAEAVNAHIYATTQRVVTLDGSYVGKLERGETRWPTAHYRAGFRAVLSASADADLGFYIIKRTADEDFDFEDDEPGTDVAVYAPRPVPMQHSAGSMVQLVITPGTAVVVVPADHPVLLALVAGNGATP